MNRTKFVKLKFFYNFHFLHFSVGRAFVKASASEKTAQSFQAVQS